MATRRHSLNLSVIGSGIVLWVTLGLCSTGWAQAWLPGTTDVTATASERARSEIWSRFHPHETPHVAAAIDNQGVVGAYDVHHMDIELTSIPPDNNLTVTCDVTLKWQQDHSPEFNIWGAGGGLWLDTVTDLSTNKKVTATSNDNGLVTIQLKQAPQKGELSHLRFTFSGAVVCGLSSSLDCNFSGPLNYMITTNFHPTNIVLADSFTATIHVTTANNLDVVATGMLTNKETAVDSPWLTRWTFDHPFSTRFLSFAVGDFESYPMAEIPWTWNLRTDTAKKSTDIISQHTEFIATSLTTAFGPLPFEKLDLAQLDNVFGGGVSPATTLFVGGHLVEYLLDDSPDQRLAIELLAHEISHQWWGNVIAPRYPNGQILSEGLAEYGASLVSEAMFQDRDMLTLNAQHYTHLLSPAYDTAIADNTVVYSSWYVPIIYSKGSFVMAMLADEVGPEVFWAALRNLVQTKAFDFITIEEFLDFVQSWTEKDLTDFYDNWFYKAGYPELDVKVTVGPQIDGQWKTTVFIEQSGTDLYKLKIPLRFLLHGQTQGVDVENFELIGKSKARTYLLEAPPKSLLIDPETRLLQRTTAGNIADLNLDGVEDGRDLLDLAENYDQHVKSAKFDQYFANMNYRNQYDVNQNSRIDETDLELYLKAANAVDGQ